MSKKKIFSTFLSLSILSLIVFSSCSEDSPVQNNPGTGGTINVSGKLINTNGTPIGGATVSIAGTSVTAASDGSFTINNVTTPYNLEIVSGIYGIQHRGLTTSNPQLLTIGPIVTENSAMINVTVPAMSANQICKVIYTNESNIQKSMSIPGSVTTGAFNVTWEGNSNLSGKLIALVYTMTNGAITTYDRYGERINFTLNNGSTTSVSFSTADLSVDPGEESVSGSIIAPSALTNVNSTFMLQYLNGGPHAGGVTLDLTSGNTFSYKVPTGLTTTPKIKISGSSFGIPGGSLKSIIVTPGVTGINLNLESNPGLSSPPDNATLVDTNTIFNFSAGGGSGVYMITFVSNTNLFRVFTTETNVRIPNLSAFGLNIGSSLTYSWNVSKYSTFSNIDQLASSIVNENVNYNSYAYSNSRLFTSKP